MVARKRGGQAVYAVLLILRHPSKPKRRIKTTIGFEYEMYMKLKLLSIILRKDMQDIIAEALNEYFERDDIKTVLSAILSQTDDQKS